MPSTQTTNKHIIKMSVGGVKEKEENSKIQVQDDTDLRI